MVSALHDRYRAEIADRDTELLQLRRVIADHNSNRTRLRRLVQDRETARDKLRAHLAQLASGVPLDLVSPAVSSDSKRLRNDSGIGLPLDRYWASGPFFTPNSSSPLTPAKISTRSVDSNSSSESTPLNPATPSFYLTQTDESKPYAKILQSDNPASLTKSTKSTLPPRSAPPTRSAKSASTDEPKRSTKPVGSTRRAFLFGCIRTDGSTSAIDNSGAIS